MTTSIDLEEYQVSATYGFVPVEAPLKQLPNQYTAWETIALNLPMLISSGEIDESIASLTLIPTEFLISEREWQRAYVILGFIANGYLWGAEKPLDVVYSMEDKNTKPNA